jgi:hypothetical protein
MAKLTFDDAEQFNNRPNKTIKEIDRIVTKEFDTLNVEVQKIVSVRTIELDEYINHVKSIILADEPSISDLEDFAIQIPTIIYSMYDLLEDIGLKNDISKAVQKQVYSHAFDRASGTIPDKEAMAELSSKVEADVEAIYNRSYKKIKAKLEMGLELLGSVKKIITSRISEQSLSKRI